MSQNQNLSYTNLKRYVHNVIPPRIVNEMFIYLNNKSPKLIIMSKVNNFLRKSLYLLLYKDLFNVGHQYLHKRTKNWIVINHKSLRENNDRIRKVLSTWGEQYIYLEDKAALQRRTRKRRFPKEFRDVCLWFDSSDFRLTG